MKNKKLLVIIAVAIVLLFGAFLFVKAKRDGSIGTSPVGSSVSSQKSLKELLSAGIAQKCTYSVTADSVSNEGTSYISGGKVRGDFTTIAQGKTTISHMISDGTTNYIWTEGEETGLKMTVEEGQESKEETSQDQDVSVSSGADLNQQYDYKCSAWVTDASVFSPPSNVKFTDFSQMFNTNSTQCGACNSLSGDDKTQCLSALNCK